MTWPYAFPAFPTQGQIHREARAVWQWDGSQWNLLSSLDADSVDGQDATNLGTGGAPITTWTANHSYPAGQVVSAPDGSIIAASSTHTSGATFSRTNWVTLSGTTSINVRQFGAVGNNSHDDTAAFTAAFAAAAALADVGGKVCPIIVPPGWYRLTSTLTMFDYMQLIGTGRELYGGNTIIENHTTNMFKWPTSSSRIKGLTLKGIAFFGQSSLAGAGGPYTLYPFDPAVYATKQLWYPCIRDCAFQYFHQTKLNLLGGEISGGQFLHYDSTPLYLRGYDYQIGGGGSPLFMGMDSQQTLQSTPMIYVENGSNIKFMDIFPTIVTGGRGMYIDNCHGVWLEGCRLDGANASAPSQLPMTGAALYLHSCQSVVAHGLRIHGAMGGPNYDGQNPTDIASVVLDTCDHVTLSQTSWIHQVAGSPTIGFVGTNDDINLSGGIYETDDGQSVRVDDVGAVVTNLLWDEVGVAGPAGPMPFTAPTVWDNSTSYIAPSGVTPGNAVTRSGSLYMAVANNTNVDPATDDGSNWMLLAQAGAGANYLGFFGDGSDGTVNMNGTNTFAAFATKSSSTYTLTRDVLAASLTVANGCQLNTGNFAIYVTGTLTNNGTINAAGGNTATATGGTGGGTSSQSFVRGGTGGAGQVAAAGSNGGSGGYGGANGGLGGSSGANGGGATGTTTTATVTRLKNPELMLAGGIYNAGTARALGGGGGGGGGGGDGAVSGGGGGGGGGVVGILAEAVDNAGTITAAGGNGANGLGGNAAGGAGGGGGLILIYTLSAITGAGTITAAAGNGGTGQGSGTNGNNGTAGNVLTTVLA